MSDTPLARMKPALVRLQTGAAPDGELVERYARSRDEAAFAELVRRHGPMVLSVARRLIHNAADADDVFQAAFLVLARRAGTVRPPGAVGPWLHGVTVRTAQEARRRATRRRRRESQVPAPQPTPEPEAEVRDLRPIIDAELARLPRALAQVLVLCDMEERTRREVAGLLGVPEGTVASRLARARQALARRLAARGLAVVPAALAALLVAGARAAPPPELARHLARAATAFAGGRGSGGASPAAVALAHRVLGSGQMLKFLTAGLVGLALGLTGWAAAPDRRPEPLAERGGVPVAPAVPPAPVVKKAADFRDRLPGAWRVTGGTRNGHALTEWERAGFRFEFNTFGALTVRRGSVRGERTFFWGADRGEPDRLCLAPRATLWPGAGASVGGLRKQLANAGPPAAQPERPVPYAFDEVHARPGAFALSLGFEGPALVLGWEEPAADRNGAPDRHRLELARVGDAPSGPEYVLHVRAAPGDTGPRLLGEWATGDGSAGGAPGTVLSFAPERGSDVVPAAYRDLFEGAAVLQTGRMTVARPSAAAVAYPFLLVERDGRLVVSYFLPRGRDPWAADGAVTVALTPGQHRDGDRLDLGPYGADTGVPTGTYHRVNAKN